MLRYSHIQGIVSLHQISLRVLNMMWILIQFVILALQFLLIVQTNKRLGEEKELLKMIFAAERSLHQAMEKYRLEGKLPILKSVVTKMNDPTSEE